MSVGILVLVVTHSKKQIPIWIVASDSWVNSNLSGDKFLITDSRLKVDAPMRAGSGPLAGSDNVYQIR
jgi:hypothetical protein